MNPLKPMAMLSSGLLARKGAAVPAALALPSDAMAPPRLELRMPPARPPEPAAWSRTDEKIDAAPRIRATGGTPPLPSESGSAKVSLRLDADRHRRLRLAALHQGSSGQKLLLAALDAYLDSSGAHALEKDCACLRRRPG